MESGKDQRYLSARDAGKIYKGQVYWYPLSGQVHLKLGPRPIRFSAGSKEVMLGSKTALLQRAVLTRADQAYIPFGLFLSEDFARHMGIRTDFDSEAGVLRIGKDDDSDFLRYFSYPDKTRIVLEFDAPAPEPSSQRRGDRLEISIPKAVAAGGKKIGIDDERVDEVSLSQQKKGMLLSVRSADCLPILLADPRRRAVAAVHTGWKGALGRVPEKTVGVMRALFGSDPRDIAASIGPGIRSCCYEVGEEVVAAFEARFVNSRRFFRFAPPSNPSEALSNRYPLLFLSKQPPGHLAQPESAAYLDLVAVAREQLRAAGLRPSNIHVADFCTACRTDLFFSHRKEGSRTGRVMAVIGIRPGKK